MELHIILFLFSLMYVQDHLLLVRPLLGENNSATYQSWALQYSYYKYTSFFNPRYAHQSVSLSLILVCSKFYRLFLQHFPKNLTHYSCFILILLPIIPILFFCINVLRYILTSREMRTWYGIGFVVDILCKF